MSDSTAPEPSRGNPSRWWALGLGLGITVVLVGGGLTVCISRAFDCMGAYYGASPSPGCFPDAPPRRIERGLLDCPARLVVGREEEISIPSALRSHETGTAYYEWWVNQSEEFKGQGGFIQWSNPTGFVRTESGETALVFRATAPGTIELVAEGRDTSVLPTAHYTCRISIT